MLYLKLYLVFAKIGLFSIGGGYASLPLIEENIVNNYKWLNNSEFLDLLSISQMTPGPIAINAATFVGTKVAGVFGAIVATLGFITPSAIIISIFSYIYFKYKDLGIFKSILNSLRGSVIALIGISGYKMILQQLHLENNYNDNFNILNLTLMIITFIILRIVKKIDPLIVMLCIGILGMILSGIFSV